MKCNVNEIDSREVLRYLGYRGQVLSEGFLDKLNAYIKEALKIASPQVTYRFMGIQEGEKMGILQGDSIKKHVKDCDTLVLMAATIGMEAEKYLVRQEVLDMEKTVILDACFGAVIERTCDQLEEALREKALQEGKVLTGRFSPGYGDYPIELQKEFIRLLDTERLIGLHVTGNSLLVPRKSVTAVLGMKVNKE